MSNIENEAALTLRVVHAIPGRVPFKTFAACIAAVGRRVTTWHGDVIQGIVIRSLRDTAPGMRWDLFNEDARVAVIDQVCELLENPEFIVRSCYLALHACGRAWGTDTMAQFLVTLAVFESLNRLGGAYWELQLQDFARRVQTIAAEVQEQPTVKESLTTEEASHEPAVPPTSDQSNGAGARPTNEGGKGRARTRRPPPAPTPDSSDYIKEVAETQPAGPD